MFDVTVEQHDTVVIVRVEGEIDSRTEPALFDLLARTFTVAEEVVVVDLAGCTSTSSGAVQALDAAGLMLRKRGMSLLVRHATPG
jgi:anti-anti-sigma factor